MWRKSDPIGDGSPTLGATDGPKAVHPAASPAQMARISGSLAIKGDLYGEEDLFIEGTIEGKITVKQGSVTIGERGRVLADIHATNIQVAGNVRGDLTGSERVVLLETGSVEGNITAKSVTLENGARFKGSIDMESVNHSPKNGSSRKPPPPQSV